MLYQIARRGLALFTLLCFMMLTGCDSVETQSNSAEILRQETEGSYQRCTWKEVGISARSSWSS